jgi:hypothetical protein
MKSKKKEKFKAKQQPRNISREIKQKRREA